LLVPLMRRPALHAIACGILGLVAASSVSWVAGRAPDVAAPIWLKDYLWPTGVGKFPLVPWMAFPLFGVCLGRVIFSRNSAIAQCASSLLLGAAFIVASKTIKTDDPYGPQFVFERTGWVLIGLAACCWLQEPVPGTKWILEFGQLSLWSYTVHLVIVYGSAISFGLDTVVPWTATWIAQQRNPNAAVITGFSVPIVLCWLAAVLIVTAWVVRWRAKSLQRAAALRMMPAK